MTKAKKKPKATTQPTSAKRIFAELQSVIVSGNSRIEAAKGKARHKIQREECKKREDIHARLCAANK